jgi:hypothetical protein
MLEMRLAKMTPRISPIKLPKRFFKETFLNRFSIRRVRAERRRPPKNPHKPIRGEIPFVKKYPLAPQMRNRKRRRIQVSKSFTSFR